MEKRLLRCNSHDASSFLVKITKRDAEEKIRITPLSKKYKEDMNFKSESNYP